MSGPVVEQLLPCPFCGGEARVWLGKASFDDAQIVCGSCHMSGPNFDESPYRGAGARNFNADEAITAWNTRASTAPLIAAMEAAAGIIRRYRDETPPGHSPHMICHEADEVMEQLTAQIEAARKGE